MAVIRTWLVENAPADAIVSVNEIKGCTPVIVMEIQAAPAATTVRESRTTPWEQAGIDTALLQGHLDERSEMTGLRNGLGPWTVVAEGDRAVTSPSPTTRSAVHPMPSRPSSTPAGVCRCRSWLPQVSPRWPTAATDDIPAPPSKSMSRHLARQAISPAPWLQVALGESCKAFFGRGSGSGLQCPWPQRVPPFAHRQQGVDVCSRGAQRQRQPRLTRIIRPDGGVAEGGGFEPPGPAKARWFSRPVQSSALPSLRQQRYSVVATSMRSWFQSWAALSALSARLINAATSKA